jgi:AcrR family transcriptional regulator
VKARALAGIDALPDGKRRLIEAAFRLGARDGIALPSLGLRELAREAGLNHNTFYRHFRDMDDLGRTAAEMVAAQLMKELKEIPAHAKQDEDVTISTVAYFLDFVENHIDAMIVGLREMHSKDSPMRGILQQAVEDIALDRAEQIISMKLATGLERKSLQQATRAITYYMFYRALDYIESPRRRRSIHADIVGFVRTQFIGRLTLQQMAAEKK